MIASLELAAGKRDAVNEFAFSDQVRILTVTASAVNEQKQSEQAQIYFSDLGNDKSWCEEILKKLQE